MSRFPWRGFAIAERRFKYMAKSKKKSSGIYDSLRKSLGNPTYGRRQFKRDVNKLVKAGLYNPKSGIENLAPGKYVNSLLRKFSNVLEGRAQALKVNPGEVKKYREQGLPTRNGRVIVEAPKGSKVERLRPENGVPRYRVTQNGKNGTRVTVREIVPYSDLEARIRRIVYNKPEPKSNEAIGFRFFGNNSARYFAHRDMLLDFFLAYQSVEEAVRSGDTEAEQEIYQNFEVTIIKGRKGEQAWGKEYHDRQIRQQSERARAARARFRAREQERYRNMDELDKRIFRDQKYKDRAERAERERNRRAQLKHDDPAAYAKMLEQNAARAKASRKNKKK
jgi:hypothetical protein